MTPIFGTAMRRAARAMRRHQGVPPRARLPMWRLLIGEIRYAWRSLVGRG